LDLDAVWGGDWGWLRMSVLSGGGDHRRWRAIFLGGGHVGHPIV